MSYGRNKDLDLDLDIDGLASAEVNDVVLERLFEDFKKALVTDRSNNRQSEEFLRSIQKRQCHTSTKKKKIGTSRKSKEYLKLLNPTF